jgi:hypothetical protein
MLLVCGTPLLQLVVLNVFAENNKLVTTYSQHTEGVDEGVTVGVIVGVIVGVCDGIGKQGLQSGPYSIFNDTTSDPLMLSTTPRYVTHTPFPLIVAPYTYSTTGVPPVGFRTTSVVE